jgi:uncharacterized membrane protein YhaH (DUF805 family)
LKKLKRLDSRLIKNIWKEKMEIKEAPKTVIPYKFKFKINRQVFWTFFITTSYFFILCFIDDSEIELIPLCGVVIAFYVLCIGRLHDAGYGSLLATLMFLSFLSGIIVDGKYLGRLVEFIDFILGATVLDLALKPSIDLSR